MNEMCAFFLSNTVKDLQSKIKHFDIFFLSFLQSNGYKPTPLDLSGIQLNEKMVELVDLLAENTHNVWAKDRIKYC